VDRLLAKAFLPTVPGCHHPHFLPIAPTLVRTKQGSNHVVATSWVCGSNHLFKTLFRFQRPSRWSPIRRNRATFIALTAKMKAVYFTTVLTALVLQSSIVVCAFQNGGSPKALKPAADKVTSSESLFAVEKNGNKVDTALSVATTGSYLDTLEKVGTPFYNDRNRNSFGTVREPQKPWHEQPNRYGYSYATPWYESQRRRPNRFGNYGTRYNGSSVRNPSYSSYSTPWYERSSTMNRPWYDRPTNRNGYTANSGSLTRVVRAR